MNLIIPMMSEKHIAARGQKSSRYSSDGPTDLPAAGGAGIGAAPHKGRHGSTNRSIQKGHLRAARYRLHTTGARRSHQSLGARAGRERVHPIFFGEHPHIVI